MGDVTLQFAVNATATYASVSYLQGQAASSAGGSGGSIGPKNEDLKPVRIVEGAPKQRFTGRHARVNGTIVYSKKKEHKQKISAGGGGGGKGGGGSGVSQTSYTYTADLVVAFGEAFEGTDGLSKIHRIDRIKANGKRIWEFGKEDQYDNLWDSVVISLGADDANVQSWLEDIFGVDKVPGFRGTAVAYIRGLKLDDWAGNFPQQIDAVLQPNPGPFSVGDAVHAIWSRIEGRDPDDDIDTSAFTGANLSPDSEDGVSPMLGLQVDGFESPLRMIETLMSAYDGQAQPREGKLHFFDRGTEPVIVVDAGDLEAVSDAPSHDRPALLEDRSDFSIPSEITLSYRDPESGYQVASVRESINDAPPGQNAASVDLPIVLSRKAARQVARRRLYEPMQLRGEMTFRVPWSRYCHGLAGDVWAVPKDGQVFYVRALEVTRGANWTLEVHGTVDDVRNGADPILSSAAGNLGSVPVVDDDPEDGVSTDEDELEDLLEAYVPPEVTTIALNLPAQKKDHLDEAVITFGVCAKDPSAAWVSHRLFVSEKADGPYYEVKKGAAQSEAVMGKVLNVKWKGTNTFYLRDDQPGVGGFRGWDEETELTVLCYEGELESAPSKLEVYSERKYWLAFANGEILAYRTSTPVAGTTHDLTGLGMEVGGTGFFLKRNNAGVDFTTILAIGDYIQVVGLGEAANKTLLRRVEGLLADTIAFSLTGTEPLTPEGPVADTVKLSMAVNPGVFKLTGLLRGLLDTGDHCQHPTIASAYDAEEWISLDPDNLTFVKRSHGKIGQLLYYKALPFGLDLADGIEQSIEITGESFRPFRPAAFQAYRDGTGPTNRNVKLKWRHRTRAPFQSPWKKEPHHLVLEFEPDRYVIEVYASSAMAALLATIKVTAADEDHGDDQFPDYRTHNFSEAQQAAAAGGSVLGNALFFRIRQVGKVLKQGNWSTCEIGAA